jgi:hypothetical protein
VANRTFNQFQGALQKGVVTLFAKVEIDLQTGDATLVTSETILGPQNPTNINPSAGFSYVQKFPSGGPAPDTYSLGLQDPYVRLLNVTAVEDVVNFGSTINNFRVLVSGNVNDQNDPYVDVVLSNSPITSGSGTSTVLFMVTLANSTAL